MIKLSDNIKYGLIGGFFVGGGFLARDILISSAGNIFAFTWNWQMFLDVLPIFAITATALFASLCLIDLGAAGINKAKSIIFNNNETNEKEDGNLLSLNDKKNILNDLYDNNTKKNDNKLDNLNQISKEKSRINF